MSGAWLRGAALRPSASQGFRCRGSPRCGAASLRPRSPRSSPLPAGHLSLAMLRWPCLASLPGDAGAPACPGDRPLAGPGSDSPMKSCRRVPPSARLGSPASERLHRAVVNTQRPKTRVGAKSSAVLDSPACQPVAVWPPESQSTPTSSDYFPSVKNNSKGTSVRILVNDASAAGARKELIV